MYALLKKIDAIEKQHKDRIEELKLSEFTETKQSEDNRIAIRQEISRLREEVKECIKLTHNI